MERRKFLGAVPLVIGGSLAMVSSESSAQTQASTIWTNVKDFGATGNGVTDDTAAIQAAISSLQQNNDYRGGVLYFPAGQYICSATLAFTSYATGDVHNIIVRGDGPQCTYLDFTAASSGSAGLTFNFGAQFGVEDIMINGAPGDGVLVGAGNTVGGSTYCSLFTIRNVRVQNCGNNGFAFINAYMGTVEECWSTGNNGIGFLFNGYHTSIKASRCWASNNTGIGWSLNGMTYSSFISCGADNNLWGYAMTNMVGIAFVSCGAESNKNDGWLMETSTSSTTGLPSEVVDIHGMTFTSCSSYFNSQAGENAYASHIAALATNNRPIEFKMSGNTSFCNTGSSVSMVLNATSGPITVYDELSYFNGSWVTSGTVTHKTF
ncbi:glycosyl hydrolase family 28-related protein [Dyella flava]|uniref:Rhamnogalacturonase A/B/Epimerase-like pectate lyase domain-containing protein n=1 Tax=Dyella flava TaxID=1920170 RepID=A0ABS2K6H0_9GAMM|nr:glycosyl hydrolase family 28-related protein [Dyella flava]MBM7126813.1 hypothetical protein [Dyella flava]